ncbi:hypothetical protein [Porphyrobacter sp. GA68]|uniref:hypothetical protein n=1 Tax=Porphyrobacter sp. GA68 TaxID=2883480 RepID=UPI001D19229B|nr:hypothetical protein [Porphyrobacter sp. GA68]
MSQAHRAAARRRNFLAEAKGFAVSLIGEALTLAKTPTAIVAALLILPAAAFLTGMGIVVAYGEYHGHDLPDRLMLSRDNTFSERFEYVLTGAAALAMLLTWRRTGATAYMVFAVLFGWLTADNSLQLHERLGVLVGTVLRSGGFPAENARHFGEAAVMCGIGALLIGMIVWSLAGSGALHRLRATILLLLIGGTACFGVVVDAIDALVFAEGSAAQQVGAFVEDAGELWLLCLTVICALAVMVRSSGGSHDLAEAASDTGRPVFRTQAPPRP